MKNLFEEIGSASHNIGQKIKNSMTDRSSLLEINGYQLALEDTISEGGLGFTRRLRLHHPVRGPEHEQEVRAQKEHLSGTRRLTQNEERKKVAMAECQFLVGSLNPVRGD